MVYAVDKLTEADLLSEKNTVRAGKFKQTGLHLYLLCKWALDTKVHRRFSLLITQSIRWIVWLLSGFKLVCRNL